MIGLSIGVMVSWCHTILIRKLNSIASVMKYAKRSEGNLSCLSATRSIQAVQRLNNERNS
jgi:hypothetical protein